MKDLEEIHRHAGSRTNHLINIWESQDGYQETGNLMERLRIPQEINGKEISQDSIYPTDLESNQPLLEQDTRFLYTRI